MHQPASRTFLAAFSHITKKQPNVCIQAIITPLLQQNQFGELVIVFAIHVITYTHLILNKHYIVYWKMSAEENFQRLNQHCVSKLEKDKYKENVCVCSMWKF